MVLLQFARIGPLLICPYFLATSTTLTVMRVLLALLQHFLNETLLDWTS